MWCVAAVGVTRSAVCVMVRVLTSLAGTGAAAHQPHQSERAGEGSRCDGVLELRMTAVAVGVGDAGGASSAVASPSLRLAASSGVHQQRQSDREAGS
jgi:hypothetical protein